MGTNLSVIRSPQLSTLKVENTLPGGSTHPSRRDRNPTDGAVPTSASSFRLHCSSSGNVPLWPSRDVIHNPQCSCGTLQPEWQIGEALNDNGNVKCFSNDQGWCSANVSPFGRASPPGPLGVSGIPSTSWPSLLVSFCSSPCLPELECVLLKHLCQRDCSHEISRSRGHFRDPTTCRLLPLPLENSAMGTPHPNTTRDTFLLFSCKPVHLVSRPMKACLFPFPCFFRVSYSHVPEMSHFFKCV